MYEVLGIVLFLCGFIGVGIMVEKVRHPNFNLAESTRHFKKDLSCIISVLFSGDTVRHIFDASLWENFLKILEEYHHNAFTPACQVDFYDGTPRLCITFVPNRELNAEELSRLCKLLCLKFRQYLQLYGLCWRLFPEYHVLNGTVIINIFYSEFKDDLQPFLKRYRIAVKHKTVDNYGVLHDDSLDKEINHARQKH